MATSPSTTKAGTPEAGPPEAARLARARVDAGAIAANWAFFAKLAGTAQTAAVVKADGYGLGAQTAARALAHAGARTFFTASAGEALEIRRVLGEGPQILVLNGPSEADIARYGPARLTPVLNSPEQIALWGARAPAALHVDTGMNRLGLAPEAWALAAPSLQPALLISHLACAAAPSHEMNARQRTRFLQAAALFPHARLSLAASAGALIGTEYHFDLIRPGIGLYGSGGWDEGGPLLAPAVMIEAPILQVRDVAAGESFGYGAAFTAPKPMRAATASIGYADGYLRSLGGRGYGVLAGARLAILGRISMDLVILDVTDCPQARPGAMVEFLGPNAPLDDIARLAGTAPYEILTSLAGTVRRRGVLL